MDERYTTVNGKANVEITPVRKDAPIAPSDDRYVVLERGQYNNLVSNRFGVGVLSICGLVGVVSVATAMVINALKPIPILTNEKPVVIEKPVIVQCGLFGCRKSE